MKKAVNDRRRVRGLREGEGGAREKERGGERQKATGRERQGAT